MYLCVCVCVCVCRPTAYDRLLGSVSNGACSVYRASLAVKERRKMKAGKI